jgi:hypothetical protein
MKPRTVRLPDNLDLLIESEARERGITSGEIIREVLSVHYRIRDGETSLEDVVRRMVGDCIDDRIRSGALHIPERVHRAPDRIPHQQAERTRRAPDRTRETPQASTESITDPDIIEVLKIIKAHLDRGEEPTVDEVAQEAEVDKRPLGRSMKAAGVQAKNTTRAGVAARYYTLDLKPRIEELIAKEELEE